MHNECSEVAAVVISIMIVILSKAKGAFVASKYEVYKRGSLPHFTVLDVEKHRGAVVHVTATHSPRLQRLPVCL